MSRISLQNNIINRDQFKQIIDTEFNELGRKANLEDTITIDKFFEIYENIFYEIPRNSDFNSHLYMLNKAAEYLGLKISDDNDLDLLRQEITELKVQLLDINKSITTNK